MPTANDILGYLLDNSPWVDRARTVDTVKAGDPTRPVRKAAVCWYASYSALVRARDLGCDLVVTHEPTFWEHGPEERRWRTREPGLRKQRLLDETGIVILRAHDTWDNWPEIGIRDSWARDLGLTDRVAESQGHRFHAVYAIPEQSLRQFARHVARRIRRHGEDSVQVIGDPDRKVRRPAVGVGCIVPDVEMVEAGADTLVHCYDGASYWATRERLAEMGVAILTVEHGTSEMAGLESLCRHLAGQFPEVSFQYLAEHPRTWTVRA